MNSNKQSTVWLSISSALRNLDKVYGEAVKPLGVTVMEAHALCSLYVEDRQKASQLATSVGMKATSYTPVLDKLEKKGLIERVDDAHDRRALHVCLTERAREIEGDLVSRMRGVDRRVTSAYTSRQLAFDVVAKILREVE